MKNEDKKIGFLRFRGSVVMDIDYRRQILCISELKYFSYFLNINPFYCNIDLRIHETVNPKSYLVRLRKDVQR